MTPACFRKSGSLHVRPVLGLLAVKRDPEPWDEPDPRPPYWLALSMALYIALPVLFAGCRTWDQIQATPSEVWVSLWMICEAVVLDVVDLVKLLL